MTICVVGWLLFVSSFALPVADGLNGWQAMATAFLSVFLRPEIIFLVPRTAIFLVFPLLNGLIFVSPLAIFYMDDEDAHFLAVVLCFCGAAAFMIPWELVKNVYIGFYVCIVSVFMLALGCLILSITAHCFWQQDEDRRKWSQFSLAGLLLLAVMVALTCSLFRTIYEWQIGSCLLFLVALVWPSIVAVAFCLLPRQFHPAKLVAVVTVATRRRQETPRGTAKL